MGTEASIPASLETEKIQDNLETILKEREEKEVCRNDEEVSEELDAELLYDGEYTELKLSSNKKTLKWRIARIGSQLDINKNVKASLERFEVRVDKIYGLTVSEDGLKFTIYALGRKNDGIGKEKESALSNIKSTIVTRIKTQFSIPNQEWFQNEYVFEAKTQKQASRWLDEFAEITGMEWEEKDYMVIFNPTKDDKSLEIWNELKPMFKAANIFVHVEKAKNIQDMVYSTTRLCQYKHMVVLGNDKTFHDAINGILTRPDFDRVTARVVISAIPTEYGNNAVSKFMGVSHPYLSALTAIRGQPQPFDVMSVMSPTGFRMFSHLNFHWGLLSDIQMDPKAAKGKEKVGFNFNTVAHCVFPRAFEGTLHYLPVTDEESIEEGLKPAIPVSVTTAERLAKPGPADHLDNLDVNNLPEKWQTVNAAFSLFFATNVSQLTPSLIGSPLAITSDGAVDIAYTQGGFWNFITWILFPSKGLHLSSKGWNFARAKAFILEPGKDLNGADGCLTVDGERIPYTTVKCEIHKGAIKIQTPIRKVESRAQKWKANLQKWGSIISKKRKPMITFEDYKLDMFLTWIYSFGLLLLVLAIIWKI